MTAKTFPYGAALRWTFTAGLVLIVAAGVTGTVSPLTAAILAGAALLLLSAGLMAIGLAQEAAYRHERHVEQYVSEIADGGPLAVAQRAEVLAGQSQLEDPAVLKSIARRLRRHPEASG